MHPPSCMHKSPLHAMMPHEPVHRHVQTVRRAMRQPRHHGPHDLPHARGNGAGGAGVTGVEGRAAQSRAPQATPRRLPGVSRGPRPPRAQCRDSHSGRAYQRVTPGGRYKRVGTHLVGTPQANHGAGDGSESQGLDDRLQGAVHDSEPDYRRACRVDGVDGCHHAHRAPAQVSRVRAQAAGRGPATGARRAGGGIACFDGGCGETSCPR